jgi:FdhD protein
MENSATRQVKMMKWINDEWNYIDDVVAVEAPLDIELIYYEKGIQTIRPLSLTMRTPGHDIELALGFLYNEGIISKMADVDQVLQPSEQKVSVILKPGIQPILNNADRNFFANSSCGVCGKTNMDGLQQVIPNFEAHQSEPLVDLPVIAKLQDTLEAQQLIFAQTGGLHASAIFNTGGMLQILREDVGRHNALDKVIGHALMHHQLPLRHHLLLLSGRVSFELIQKAAMAGIPLVVAVGAPSSLAITMAEKYGITLVGFMKRHTCNIYTAPQRIVFKKTSVGRLQKTS